MFWVHASSYTRFEQGYRDIANRIELSGREDPKVDILQLVCQWLGDEGNGSWLLILDNADDAALFTHAMPQSYATSASILAYIPQTSTGLILVTSRNREAASRLIGHDKNMIIVESMSETEALTLLQEKLSNKPLDIDALKLVKALSYIPLAITQAAAYISRRAPRINVAKYVNLFLESEVNQRSLLGRDEGDLRRDPDVHHAVITTWQISFDQIKKDNPLAANILSLMSVFNRQGISESLLCRDGDQLAFEDALGVLCGFSLIVEESSGTSFEMHRLVQLATRTWLEVHGEIVKWKREALAILSNAFPRGEYENWIKCVPLLSHVEAVLSYKLQDPNDLINQASILHNFALYLWLKGDYQLSKLKIDQAIEIRSMDLDEEDRSLLASMNLCALVLQGQGKYEEAEAMNRRALLGSEKVLGKEHPDTLTGVSNLAGVLRHQGKYEEAEAMNRRALLGYEKVLGKEHPHTLMGVSNLAGVLRRQGKYEEAEAMNRRALLGSEKVLGKEHPDTLTSVINLAGVLRRQGKYEEAEAINRRALLGYEKVLGKEHPHTLTSVSNLAGVLEGQGKYEEAEVMNRRALLGYEKVLGKEHPDTLTSVSNLAGVLRRQGKYEEAEAMNRRALLGYEKVLGKEHPNTLTSIYYLAYLLHKQKRYEDASELYQTATSGYKMVLGQNHPTTIACNNHYNLMRQEMYTANKENS